MNEYTIDYTYGLYNGEDGSFGYETFKARDVYATLRKFRTMHPRYTVVAVYENGEELDPEDLDEEEAE